MKVFKIYTGAMLATLMLVTGCADSFLDIESTEYATQEQVEDLAKTDPGKVADAFLGGVYANIYAYQASHDDFGQKALDFARDCMSDDVAMSASGFFIYDNQLENRLGIYRRVNTTWTYLYQQVRGANQVIGFLTPTDGSEPTADQKLVLAEVLAIRAYAYFDLMNSFAQPYSVDKTASSIPLHYEKGEPMLAGQPVQDVYKLIIGDLKKAYEYMEDADPIDVTRVSKFTIAGMLARALAFYTDEPNQWMEVAKYADIASQGGTLMTADQIKNYYFNSVNNSEVLFGSRINAETNTFYASFMSHLDPYSPGYGSMSFKMIAADLYDKIADTDVRKGWFAADDISFAGYVIPKYTQLKFQDIGGFESDYIYMRVGEMKLLEVEALFEANNEVAARTKLIDFMQYRQPGYTTTLSGDALKAEIYLQKRIECWGEGQRLLDMKRRGEDLDRSAAVKAGQHILIGDDAINVDIHSETFIYEIPQAELDANPALREGEVEL